MVMEPGSCDLTTARRWSLHLSHRAKRATKESDKNAANQAKASVSAASLRRRESKVPAQGSRL